LEAVESYLTLVVFVMNYFYSSNQIYELQKKFLSQISQKKFMCGWDGLIYWFE